MVWNEIISYAPLIVAFVTIFSVMLENEISMLIVPLALIIGLIGVYFPSVFLMLMLFAIVVNVLIALQG